MREGERRGGDDAFASQLGAFVEEIVVGSEVIGLSV